ncbi:hypothetical protein ACFWIW_11000 [Amycolatopsis sp. NPDC058340]|uniref:hypothetical protein n=1 Tax=Amycolatopsis sp. NPDC058340 TaxID=3346453 RepID=UPI0036610558
MIDQKDTAPRHAAVDGPTLPGGVKVVHTDGGRRYKVEPDEQPTTFLDGFEDAAAEHTAELEALAVEKGTRVTALFAMVRFMVVAFVGVLVDVAASGIEASARWELTHARMVARIALATVSALVLAGAGVGWWLA